MTTPQEVLKSIQEQEIQMIDLKFIDTARNLAAFNGVPQPN